MALIVSWIPDGWQECWNKPLGQLGNPELQTLFLVVKEVLQPLDNATIQDASNSLLQSIASNYPPMKNKGQTLFLPQPVSPRLIQGLFDPCPKWAPTPPPTLTLLENLAIGAFVSLAQVVRAFVKFEQDPGAWRDLLDAVVIASSIGEWLYVVSMQKEERFTLCNPTTDQDIRRLAKKKISSQASKKSKQQWQNKLDAEKQKVYQAYEAGKPWTSVKAAAEKLYNDDITHAVKYDKLYKWLLEYKKHNHG